LREQPGDVRRLGVDVARFGDDKSMIYARCGPRVALHKVLAGHDTMAVSGAVVQAVEQLAIDEVFVDDIGVGGGVTDRLRELGVKVTGVNVSSRPRDPKRFLNLRAELYWDLRDAFEEGRLSIEIGDNDLLAELAATRYELTSSGRIKIEPKEAIRTRLGRSPDRADAVMLTMAQPRKRAKVRVSGVR
jgi:hypothetical protein